MISSSQNYSVLLVGLGQMGMGYDISVENQNNIRTHAKAIATHEGYNLTCAVDPSQKQRETFSHNYEAPAYSTIEDALAAHEVDIVIISAPSQYHLVSVRTLLAGRKPQAILCEKPLGQTVEEAELIVKLCTEAEIPLYVNYIRTSVPGIVDVKKRLDDKRIASPVRGVIWYSKGFLHNASHFFQLTEFWLGDFQDARLVSNGRDVGDGDAEPEVKAVFEKGEVSFIPAWEEHFSHYTVELLSPNGRLYMAQRSITWQPVIDDPITASYKYLSDDVETIPTGLEQYQWHVLEQLALNLNGHESFICTGEQALKSLRAMHRILEMRNS